MKKRKKLAEIRADVAAVTRADTIAEVCRVLKWHLKETDLAEKLYLSMTSGEKHPQHPPVGVISYYSGFDEVRYL